MHTTLQIHKCVLVRTSMYSTSKILFYICENLYICTQLQTVYFISEAENASDLRILFYLKHSHACWKIFVFILKEKKKIFYSCPHKMFLEMDFLDCESFQAHIFRDNPLELFYSFQSTWVLKIASLANFTYPLSFFYYFCRNSM